MPAWEFMKSVEEEASEMMKTIQRSGRRAVMASLFAALLAACGGGAGSPATAEPPAPPPPPPSGGGDVPAALAFVPGTSPRFMLIGLSSQSFGVLGSFTQRNDGAMTALAANTLSGAPVEIRDIGSDPSRAVGRWTQGTVTAGLNSRTLTGGDSNDVFHYQVYNLPAELPTTGNVVCAEGVFSTPTFVGSGPGSILAATAAGSATFTPGANGVAIRLTINLEANGGTGTAVFDATLESPSTTALGGDAFGTGQSSIIGVGDGGNGSFLVVAAYSAVVDGGVVYQGVGSLRCK
jgi:hypothetical protein